MKRWIGTLILIFTGYLLQTTLLQGIRIAGIAPNILIILLVAVAYRYGKISGMITGFLIGLLIDLVEGDIIGLYSLIYMVVGYLTGFANKIYFHDDTTMPVFLVAFGDFSYNFMIYALGFLLRNRLHFFFYLRSVILPEMLYTVVLSIFIYRFLHKLLRALEPKGQEET